MKVRDGVTGTNPDCNTAGPASVTPPSDVHGSNIIQSYTVYANNHGIVLI